MKKIVISFIALIGLFTFNVNIEAQDYSKRKELADKLLKLDSQSKWEKVDSIKLQFNAHHTQGLVKVGEYFFMSAVDVIRWPKGFGKVLNGLDRDAGEGKGHIFKFDKTGKLLYDLPIGEGDAYHPGGLDYDGKYIWIPVTEYRPKSFSIMYRLNPETMEVKEILRYPESIGAIVHNTDNNTLVGANWSARYFYTWTLNKEMTAVTNGNVAPEKLGVENPSFYVAFQDCNYIGGNMMLGSGHDNYKNKDGSFYRFGGWEVYSLTDFRPIRQIPVKLLSPVTGSSILNNPCFAESVGNSIRAYFAPDDDEKTVVYVYDVK